MSDNKNVLIIGATGKIGRRLQPLLTAQGHTVRSTTRQATEPSLHFDWQDESTYAPVLAGMNAVFLVPPAFVEDPSQVTQAFLQEAERRVITTFARKHPLRA